MPKRPLPELSVPHPCPVAWDSMIPGKRSRHCARCDRTVHEFSRLRRDEIADLLEKSAGPLCARLEYHADGALVTADRPSRAVVGLALASALALAGCEEKPPPPAPSPVAPATRVQPRSEPSGPPPQTLQPIPEIDHRRYEDVQRREFPKPLMPRRMGTIQIIKGSSEPDAGPKKPGGPDQR